MRAHKTLLMLAMCNAILRYAPLGATSAMQINAGPMQPQTSTHLETCYRTQICTHKSNPSQRAKKVPGVEFLLEMTLMPPRQRAPP